MKAHYGRSDENWLLLRDHAKIISYEQRG